MSTQQLAAFEKLVKTLGKFIDKSKEAKQSLDVLISTLKTNKLTNPKSD